MSDIHPIVVRVTAAAKERGLEISTRRFPEGTKTAADAAAAIGVTVALKFVSQLWPAALHDATLGQNVHEVRL